MTGPDRRKFLYAAIVRAAFLLPFAAGVAYSGPGFAEGGDTRSPTSLAEIKLSFAPAVRRAAPSVVNIHASRMVQERRSLFDDHPFFREFFRGFGEGGLVRRRMATSLGSGVLVSPDGLVVTAEHMISEAREIRVVLADRREYDATVLLADPTADLAVLRLAGARDLPVLRFRDAEELEVGDLVLAIGNPLGIGQTVTSGIISALARTDGKDRYFLQTDAAINIGNSGGALVDQEGSLVGINTAILTRTGGSDGIGFAVPSNLASLAVKAARAGRDSIPRPWAGMTVQSVGQDLADALQMALPRGLVINAIDPRSSFVEAGVESGDVLLEVNGRPVNSLHGLAYRLLLIGPGGTASVRLMRRGRTGNVNVALVAEPEAPRGQPFVFGRRSGPFDGAEVANKNAALAAMLRLQFGGLRGVVVLSVRQRAASWLRRGDVIHSVNGVVIRDVSHLRKVVSGLPGRWRIEIERNGKRLRANFSG